MDSGGLLGVGAGHGGAGSSNATSLLLPVLLRSLALLRQAIRAASDVLIPSETVRLLLDAGAPLDALGDEAAPEGGWAALAVTLLAPGGATRRRVLEAEPDADTKADGHIQVGDARPEETALRSTPGEHSVEAAASVDTSSSAASSAALAAARAAVRCTPEPLLAGLAEGLRVLIRCLERMLTASGALRPRSADGDATVSSAREALLELTADRRVEFLHATAERLLEQLEQDRGIQIGSGSSRQGGSGSRSASVPGAAAAATRSRWLARQLRALRRLHALDVCAADGGDGRQAQAGVRWASHLERQRAVLRKCCCFAI
jgi:hypothetical protein